MKELSPKERIDKIFEIPDDNIRKVLLIGLCAECNQDGYYEGLAKKESSDLARHDFEIIKRRKR